MSNRLDNYFKERLADHETPPSTASWDKVETRISKKNNSAIVLRIAAAAVIGLVTVVMINQQENTSRPQLTEQKNDLSPSKKTAQPDNTIQKSEVDINSTKTNAEKPVVKSQAGIKSTKSIHPEKNVELQATVTPDPVVMESIDAEQIVAVAQEKPKAKRIVLVYTLPTINRTSPQDALAAEDEKRTGFQKVMDVAMEVRASDGPLGPLREAKDDLFALDFKKEKSKTKN